MVWAPDWQAYRHSWPNADASRFVEAAGLRWHVQIMGQGPVLLMLHGTGGASHSFGELSQKLVGEATLIIPDLPGHGFTSSGAGRHDLPGMAFALKALCETVGLKPSVILGHSAGAAIALQMVLQGFEIERIIGLNAALTPFRGLAALLFPTMARALSLNPLVPTLVARSLSDPAKVNNLLARTGSVVPEESARHYQNLVRYPSHVDGALRMMARWQLTPLLRQLPKITMSTCLIYGENDQTVSPSDTRRAAASLPNMEDISVPALGHLMHEEAPENLALQILKACGVNH